MARNLYITSAEGNSGKSTVALGVLDALSSRVQRVGVFRPIARTTAHPAAGEAGNHAADRDYVLETLLAHDGVDLDYETCIGVGYDEVHADPEAAMATIVERFRAVERQCDAVVIVGSDYTDVSSPTEFTVNARIAANLGAPVILVIGGRASGASGGRGLAESGPRSPEEVRRAGEAAVAELAHEHATLLALIANRADADRLDDITRELQTLDPNALVGAIPEDRYLIAPTVAAVMASCDGELWRGEEALLQREVMGAVVAGMSMENVLPRLTEGAVVMVPGDRSEVLLAVLMAHASETFPSIAAIILYGGFETPDSVQSLIDGLDPTLPIIRTPYGTYDTVLRITESRGRLAADSQRKYDTALALFEEHIDASALLDRVDVSRSDVVTPLMFEYDLLERARSQRKRIVLPEGDDDRVLRAAATLLKRQVCDITILGDEVDVRGRAAELGLDLDAAEIVSPFDRELREQFAVEYARLRAHKGVTVDFARDVVTDVSYFGTLMVHMGLADGMVSGAAHTTAHTIRPSFEIIKTDPGVSVVSSVFLMCLADRVLVYGDCAVVPDPSSTQLADIAISSAATAQQFAIEPRVAMLSYSTGESGSGDDVEKVRAATAFVRERQPELLVEGPIQYDAAAEPSVAATKMPGSPVAGRATVFVFPDLNTGNNTYKAVQRSAGAVAIGPVLQGLRKPVNDLSRGALVQDIVNTVAITAIQAQRTPPPATTAIPIISRDDAAAAAESGVTRGEGDA
ncbi:phosphate acetyltransferase [Microcella putealis]|uniref:Phosphate acetyltransferase n=1 Tax=Microcella putealis TaxID=337005 RepID=A0A4Q7LKW0_9MICO|nr:phosphate acetyltransferase [Microcella putealis]RZS55084.1 phosphate acetyltransferase [Microcella putealis]TQM19620.1 phosphate acetyltransferase [Microcella putealis]